MSYITVQTEVLRILQLLTEFDGDNSAEKDFRILGNGKQHYAVLLRGDTGKPGRSGQIDVADARKSYVRRDDYRVELQIFARYDTDPATTRAALTAIVDTVEAHFDKYPSLGGFTGITDASMDLIGESDEWTVGGGAYWRQLLIFEIVELSTVFQLEDTAFGEWFRWDGLTPWDGTGRWL